MYHLTELPAFVSAGKWCSFDPQAKFLPNVNPSNPGKMVDFIKYPETVRRYPDQVRCGALRGVAEGIWLEGWCRRFETFFFLGVLVFFSFLSLVLFWSFFVSFLVDVYCFRPVVLFFLFHFRFHFRCIIRIRALDMLKKIHVAISQP